MQYMMLIYSRERFEGMASVGRKTLMEAHWKFSDEAAAKGIIRGGAPLAPHAHAGTIRRSDGTATVTDGPYAETKEQLAGFYILECESPEEAIEWGKKIPTGLPGAPGALGVRPMREMPQREGVEGREQVSAEPARSGL